MFCSQHQLWFFDHPVSQEPIFALFQQQQQQRIPFSRCTMRTLWSYIMYYMPNNPIPISLEIYSVFFVHFLSFYRLDQNAINNYSETHIHILGRFFPLSSFSLFCHIIVLLTFCSFRSFYAFRSFYSFFAFQLFCLYFFFRSRAHYYLP